MAFRILLLTALLAFAGPVFADPAQDMSAATGVVSSFDTALLSIMKDAKSLGYQGRYDRIAPAVDKAFDIAFTAKLLVGPDWTSLPQDKQAAVIDRFRRFTIGTYANRFDGYDGETIDVTGQPTVQRDDVRVQTQIAPKGAAPVKLDYILHKDDKGWQVIDIFLNGTISQLATQRAEFQSVLKTGGVDALIAALDRKIEGLSTTSDAAAPDSAAK